jgi:hypothetical protein
MRQHLQRAIPGPTRGLLRSAIVRRRHRGIVDADLVLASFPKSGNTWARFVITHALLGSETDFDSVRSSSPYVGRQRGAPAVLLNGGRLIKSHEPYRSYADRCPTIYFVRDGRDVCVSYYFWLQRFGVDTGDFPQFTERFLTGEVGNYGSWQDHVSSWYGARNFRPSRVAVVRYEDMLVDAAGTLATAFSAIGRPLDLQRLRQAVSANTVESMRSKESASRLLNRERGGSSISVVRSGTAGGWRSAFDEVGLRRFEANAGRALRAAGYETFP